MRSSPSLGKISAIVCPPQATGYRLGGVAPSARHLEQYQRSLVRNRIERVSPQWPHTVIIWMRLPVSSSRGAVGCPLISGDADNGFLDGHEHVAELFVHRGELGESSPPFP